MHKILQLSFPNMESLYSSMFLNPNPLLHLGCAIILHATHEIFLISGVLSHQNLVRIDWILLQSEVGILKLDMEKVGNAVSTDCNITCFPAPDKNLVVHECAFCLILSTTLVKTSRLLRQNVSGSPIYFPIPPSFKIPSTFFTLSFMLTGVFAENVIVELSKLML